MQALFRVFFILAFMAFPLSRTRAGLDIDAPITNSSGLEIVVMEAPGCIYCDVFRRDILPSYQASEHGRLVPVRFVDINDDAAANALALDTPINIVPTFLVIKNNKEVGRIPGYTGPEDFFHSINFLLSGPH
jgi:thioredoxin-related protein